jgi:hypothetical protein
VIAIGPQDVRAIKVKAGSARLSKRERAAIRGVLVPANVTRKCWRFPDYCRAPQVERI